MKRVSLWIALIISFVAAGYSLNLAAMYAWFTAFPDLIDQARTRLYIFAVATALFIVTGIVSAVALKRYSKR